MSESLVHPGMCSSSPVRESEETRDPMSGESPVQAALSVLCVVVVVGYCALAGVLDLVLCFSADLWRSCLVAVSWLSRGAARVLCCSVLVLLCAECHCLCSVSCLLCVCSVLLCSLCCSMGLFSYFCRSRGNACAGFCLGCVLGSVLGPVPGFVLGSVVFLLPGLSGSVLSLRARCTLLCAALCLSFLFCAFWCFAAHHTFPMRVFLVCCALPTGVESKSEGLEGESGTPACCGKLPPPSAPTAPPAPPALPEPHTPRASTSTANRKRRPPPAPPGPHTPRTSTTTAIREVHRNGTDSSKHSTTTETQSMTSITDQSGTRYSIAPA